MTIICINCDIAGCSSAGEIHTHRHRQVWLPPSITRAAANDVGVVAAAGDDGVALRGDQVIGGIELPQSCCGHHTASQAWLASHANRRGWPGAVG